jgi:hypothetical protein
MLYVQVVSEDSQREDGYSQRIAAESWVTAKQLGNHFVMVL